MTDVLFVIALIGEVVLLIHLDRMLWGSWITPTSVLAVPYTFVVLLAWMLADTFGFYPLYVPSVSVWMLGLALFWFGGTVMAIPLTGHLRRSWARGAFRFEKDAQKFAIRFLWVAYPLVLLRLISLLGSLGGIQGLATDAFTTLYGRGLYAHIMVVSYPLLIFLIGTVNRRQYLVILTIFLGLGLVFVYQVKSWMVVPILAGLLYRWSSGRLKLTLKFSIFFLLLTIGLFFGSYLVGFGASDPSLLLKPDVYLFLARHFANYLFAGVLAFSQAVERQLEFSLSPAQVFAPLVNVYRVLMGGELISQINPNFLSLGYIGQTSNVNTLFGTLVLFLGVIGAALYVVLMAVLIYAIYLTSRLTRNCWFNVLWCFIAGMLIVGWFDFYFSNLAALEASVFCVGLGVVFELLRRKRRSASTPVGGIAMSDGHSCTANSAP